MLLPRSRILVRMSLLVAALGCGAAALAGPEPDVTLFKVVSAKDEIVVGLTGADLAAIQSPDAGGFAHALKTRGDMSVWRYTVGRDAKGQLVNAPSARVGILSHDTLRIEPYASPLATVSPAEAKR